MPKKPAKKKPSKRRTATAVKKRSVGRPTKLTPALLTQFVLHVRGGATPERVAEALGVGGRSYYRWMERGRLGDRAYVQFWRDVNRAINDMIMRAEIIVRQTDPRFFLTHSPLARNRANAPGWSGFYDDEPAPPDPSGNEGLSETGEESYDELMKRLDEISSRQHQEKVVHTQRNGGSDNGSEVN